MIAFQQTADVILKDIYINIYEYTYIKKQRFLFLGLKNFKKNCNY